MKVCLPYDRAVPPLGIYSREMRISVHTKLHIVVHDSHVCDIPGLKTAKMPLNNGMFKEAVIIPYHGLPLRGKEWTIDAYNDLGGFPEHFAEWRKAKVTISSSFA